jgi:hypothetical protein
MNKYIGKKWKILIKCLWQQLNIQTNCHRIKYCGTIVPSKLRNDRFLGGLSVTVLSITKDIFVYLVITIRCKRHRIRRYSRSVTQASTVFVRVFTSNSSSITPSWLVQPELCTYQNLIKTSGCTSQDGVSELKFSWT